MPPSRKVALITGGASGMGLAIAQELSRRGNWDIHIVDLNSQAGKAATNSVSNTTFHQCDITSYSALSTIFKSVFQTTKRLDFVFANAGIHELGSGDFYAKHNTGLEPPPEPSSKLLIVEIDLDAVINTSYLAQHYFRQNLPTNSEEMDCNLIITASCCSFYEAIEAPVYTAAKHGVLGFMRSIAPKMYAGDKIRVNAICPGSVVTNLLSAEKWSAFPEHLRMPFSRVVEAVTVLLDGKVSKELNEEAKRIDGPKKGKDGELFWGEAVEITASSWYFREGSKISDDSMRQTMDATNDLL